MRFGGKSVVVTGGAGGIGRAVVRLFAREGGKVMVSDVVEKGCQEICAEIEGQGYTISHYAGDLAEKSYCEGLIDHTVKKFGTVDILINNAGVIPRGNILQTSDEMWFAALDINLTAVFYLCRAAIPIMQKQGAGTIVNTSSVWGIYPGPGHVAYCTSKGAVAALTKNLGRDHARDNIRINAVCPNEVNTPMIRTGFVMRGLDPERALEQLNESVPLGRIAEPEDIADVIAFLASDDARYIAGATVEVTGAKPVY
jgi:NAD(P)-dependent dehydrogenase (short-subunit alcohol dehydrogenase family)